MTQTLFAVSATLCWISFLLRFVVWTHPSRRFLLPASLAEKAALLAFSGALVLYINSLQILNGEVHSLNYDRPVSLLLFAWALSVAQLVTEAAYGNTMTAIYANFWAALSLTLSSPSAKQLKRIFNNDLEWLSFHRLCFLLGYGFCVLAFPLVLRYLALSFRKKALEGDRAMAAEQELRAVDRMGYRMVLWALPLLTVGIIAELMVLMESHRLPSLEQIWMQRQESLLALTAWFLCGIYLHTRLFFGWRELRAARLYLAGLLFLVSLHLGQTFLRTTP